MVDREARRRRHYCGDGCDVRNRFIDTGMGKLAHFVLFLSVYNSRYTFSEAKLSWQTSSGCFIPLYRTRQDFNSHFQTSAVSLASTKEEYYGTLQEEGVHKKRSTRLLHHRKLHKKKRNKQLREHLKVHVNTTNCSDVRKKNRRRKQRGSKSLSTSTVAQIITAKGIETLQSRQSMPPWLARYENEEFEQYYYDDVSELSEAPPISYSDEILAAQKLKRLEQAMSGIFTDAKSTINTSPSFSPNEIHDVMDSIRVSSQQNINLIMGCADFLYLMLTLEEYDDIPGIGSDIGQVVPKTLIMTREVLVAAAFHYCDCVRARKAGVYDVVKVFMEAGGSGKLITDQHDEIQQTDNLVWLPATDDTRQEFNQNEDETAIVMTKKRIQRRGKPSIEKYGEETVRIAAGAAKLKRAEVMATTVNAKYESLTDGTKSKSITAETLSSDASILRSFLVSISEDWRALVIRSAACLYRLRGIVDEGANSMIPLGSNGRLVYSSTSMQTARDALRVYAPLAQRMGMQRLKSQIENTAFRILYPRQFDVSSALHDQDFDEMQTIIQVLSSRIEQLLMSDEMFMSNIENVSVSSRVKEPYSLWKKILRLRKVNTRQIDDSTSSKSASSFLAASLSTKWVPDAIALRVIIRGKQMPMEGEESLRTREKMLCYFALQLISDVWPASQANFAKDYIKSPKPNGYQSLHYTAALIINGDEWPFEVQIRSEEMHRIAEYGVAAHWDYKLQNKMSKALSEGSSHKPLALPTSIDAEITVAPDLTLNEKPNDGVIKQAPDISSKGRVASYIDALTSSRQTIVQNTLFIFISSTKSALDGRIVSVDPSSKLVCDVLKQYGSAIESEMLDDVEFYRNGIKISLNDSLSNGDVLTLPPSIIELIQF